jgi:Tol biopolymer transport system component
MNGHRATAALGLAALALTGLTSAPAPASAAGRAGTVTVVSVSSSGEPAGEDSLAQSVSGHGRYVAFNSRAAGLVPGDTNGKDDIFVHDRLTGVTERISVGPGGRQSNDRSVYATLSADGRFVAFVSSATNLVRGDTNKVWDVFVRDRLRGTTVRASVGPGGRQANRDSGTPPSVSADGRYVAFATYASNLVAADTNRRVDVFVHDLRTGLTQRVSLGPGRRQGNGDSDAPAMSGDGSSVAFWSTATNLVTGDTGGHADVFVRDRVSGMTERVSVNSAGRPADGDSDGIPAISRSGRYVAFASAAPNLGGGAPSFDVFVRDRVGKRTERVSFEPSADDTLEPSISADGRYVVYRAAVATADPGVYSVQVLVRDRVSRSTQSLTPSRLEAYAAFISADGRHVAFSLPLPRDGDPLAAVVWDATADRRCHGPCSRGSSSR